MIINAICRECFKRISFRTAVISTTKHRFFTRPAISRHVDTPTQRARPIRASVNHGNISGDRTTNEAATSPSATHAKSHVVTKTTAFNQTTLSVIMASLLIVALIAYVTGQFIQEVTNKFNRVDGTIGMLIKQLREMENKLEEFERRVGRDDARRSEEKEGGSWWHGAAGSSGKKDGKKQVASSS
ncbi:hypothetical protein SeLEV6574_g05842 [Synchytrium endobioticum]|uniref:Uncharacterized protein n=1 Tax=Synchytrium endobioticum TaxID=286115 RepID=A0A507CS29_9FUNG|nr:hypothetical protein SeLEV6574_g05842 [Synchytrium endobioticum]